MTGCLGLSTKPPPRPTSKPFVPVECGAEQMVRMPPIPLLPNKAIDTLKIAYANLIQMYREGQVKDANLIHCITEYNRKNSQVN